MTEPFTPTEKELNDAIGFYQTFVAMITATKAREVEEAVRCSVVLTSTPSLAWTTVNLLVNLMVTIVPDQVLDKALAALGEVGATITHEEIIAAVQEMYGER